ncbi:TraX family protein [Proteiniclasticum sp.]|uniref:TraX family protein n=1 Tax=Proteiniclasticum sp. TaxID=2053595 RepID=UPI00289A07AD|nr:TraX family protein [Proteiniclasticum sp.]
MNTMLLKLIALVTMIIDHVGAIFFPFEPWFRIIGRISFPIFCFLLVEGYFHTRDVRKYSLRLLIFAFISEVPFDLAFSGRIESSHQNIFFTLFLGLIAIHMLDVYFVKKPVLAMLGLIFAMFFSEFLRSDYGILGILYMLTIFGLRKVAEPKKYIVMAIIITLLNLFLSGGLQMYSVISIIFISYYNGKPGPKNELLKYGFYLAYPAHLMILYLISLNR